VDLHQVEIRPDAVDDQLRQMRQQDTQPSVHSAPALLVDPDSWSNPNFHKKGL